MELNARACMPQDFDRATLVGRVWRPGIGPSLVQVKPDGVYDISALAPTSAEFFNLDQPLQALRAFKGGERVGGVDEILANSAAEKREASGAYFLAPCDLQAVKASGVTFVTSLLERVIEEQARGDMSQAEGIRQTILGAIGTDLSKLKPGSPEAMRLKQLLIDRGAWSQYLEVGIGPDAELFTKCPPMASVGIGADVGIHPASTWNNPEPELVLAVNARGELLGVTLGNDVNLRDVEGRSALLLGKAKDNNASSSLGPCIRLFDEHFGVDDARRAELSFSVRGDDGFAIEEAGSLTRISRDIADLVNQAIGPNHQYPDGFVLYTGSMFAPVQDRGEAGRGFTHHLGDIVRVHSPRIGTLVNRVNRCDRVEPWHFGAAALMRNLAQRGLL